MHGQTRPGIEVPIRDVKFELTGSAQGLALGPRRAFCGPNVRPLGPCWAQHERSNAKVIYLLSGSMLDPETNAGLDAVPIQKIRGAGSVLGPGLGKIFTSLVPTD